HLHYRSGPGIRLGVRLLPGGQRHGASLCRQSVQRRRRSAGAQGHRSSAGSAQHGSHPLFFLAGTIPRQSHPAPSPPWGEGSGGSYLSPAWQIRGWPVRSPGAAWLGSSRPPLRRRIDRSGSPQRGGELGWVNGFVRRREMDLTPLEKTMRPVMVSPSMVVSIWYSPRESWSVSVSPATLPPTG